MPPLLQRIILHPLVSKIVLCLLAVVYLVYVATYLRSVYTSLFVPAPAISEHVVGENLSSVIRYWTTAHLSDAVDPAQQIDRASNLTGENSSRAAGKAAQQEGRPPLNGDPSYPLSTVGKIFFTSSGHDYVCSGTALESSNQSVVDTAGHCLYLYGSWSEHVIFCPLYENGKTPYGCWAARDLEVPADWIDAKPNDFHHDMGMAIVAPNSQGTLTDLVGGAGWAYNQRTDLVFSAYGYPAGYPFDGQTRQSCEMQKGTPWQHGGGTVVSIPCDMTGGSSGGPWFIQVNGSWYLNGHNDFISSMQPGHMFSPYYDDTWYALYTKAEHT